MAVPSADGVRHGLVGGADRHRAALGHGVARIDDEIDDGVGKLRLVGMHRPEIGACSSLRSMPSRNSRRSIMREFADHIAQRQHLGLHGLLAREGEKLAHQRRGAQRVLVDLVDLLERGIARLMAHQQEFGIADDDGEQIVEVVRHAAGQLADRLHLLRLGEFGLQRLLLGDVDEIEDHAAAAERAGEQFRHAFFLAGGAQFGGGDVVRALRRLGDEFGDARAVGGIDQVAERAARQARRRRRRIPRKPDWRRSSLPSPSANATPTGASRNRCRR